MVNQIKKTGIETILTGGGEMGALMREYDWSRSPLGEVENWPQSLKTAVRIVLTSRQPMFVWWGEQLTYIYNDAYRAILGGKHPQALGEPASVVWKEIWTEIGPRVEYAILNNEGTYDEALLLIMERNGYPEETYYTFSYSPVPNDEGNTGGILCANTDDTQRIIGERQLALLRELTASTVEARTIKEACIISAKSLGSDSKDFPFALIYQVDLAEKVALLWGSCGIESHHVAAPELVAIDEDSPWGFAEVVETHEIKLIENLKQLFDNLPTGAWNKALDKAAVVPIVPSGLNNKMAVLIVGLNPFRLFDESYQRFIELVASQISSSITNANAYEEERKRSEALAEIDRAKTIFFSNVSHEFRTPLTLMLSPLQEMLALKDDTPLGSQREMLALTHRNCLRLQKLVNTLLDFSRIEAGRIDANYEPTDIASVTAELASVFRSLVEKAGMRLVVECIPQEEPVYLDRQMWEKIVLNLLSNAFKFTLEGEIKVSLQGDNNQIEFIVQDSGVGIPADELPHLFERFHRVKRSKGRTFEGSGIGLSLVKELVQLHSGTIEVTSVLEEGTSFIVKIPKGYAHLPQERIGASRALASTALGSAAYIEEASRWIGEESEANTLTIVEQEEQISLSGLSQPFQNARIVLADDNADMRDYVKRLLSQRYQVESVSDGLAALAAIKRQKPDLVLTDVMMPRLDGFGLLQELRSNPETRDLPIIMLSARAGEEASVEGLDAGADDYLTKPFSSRELLARIEANLKMALLRQEATKKEQQLRKEAEAARDELAQSQYFLRQIAETIPGIIFIYDLDKKCNVYINPHIKTILGYTPEELKEMKSELIAQLTHPDDLEGVSNYLQSFKNTPDGVIQSYEYRHCHANGEWIWLYAQSVVFSRTNSGEANQVLGVIIDINDRKLAEEHLREQELFLQNLTNNVPVLLWTSTKDGNLTFVSQPWMDYTGLTLDYIKEHGWGELIYPDDLSQTQKSWEIATTTGSPYEMTHRLKNAKGEYHWCISRAVLTYDAMQNPLLWVGSAVEIEHQKQTEQALRESEERFRMLSDSAPVLVWMSGPDGLCTFFNQPWLEFTGRTQEQEIGNGWAEGVHPDDKEFCLNTYTTAFTNRQPFTMDYRLRRADGKYCWMVDRGVPRFTPDGDFLGYIGSCIDITDRRNAEEALRQSEEALRQSLAILNTINQATPTLIYVKDRQGRIIMANPAVLEILGKPSEQVIGYTDVDFYLNPQDAEIIIATDRQIMESGDLRIVEECITVPSGIFTFLSAKCPYRDQHGNVIGIVGVSFDISERKLYEQQLQERAEALAAVNATLAETSKSLEERNLELDQFVYIVSHDLKAPLRAISNLSQWIEEDLEGILPEENQQQLQILRERVIRMENLINGLLDYSRVTRVSNPTETVNVNQLLAEIVDSLAPPETFTIEIQPNLPIFTTQKIPLSQVFANLISNAIKHHGRLDGKITITAKELDSNYLFVVSDNGQGIPEEFHDKIFAIFQTVAISDSKANTGIGLAIVKKIVEKHGGTITLESHVGQGTTFRFTWPKFENL